MVVPPPGAIPFLRATPCCVAQVFRSHERTIGQLAQCINAPAVICGSSTGHLGEGLGNRFIAKALKMAGSEPD